MPDDLSPEQWARNHRAQAKALTSDLGRTVREIEGALLDRIEQGDGAAYCMLVYRMNDVVRTMAAKYAKPHSALFDLMVDTADEVVTKALCTYDRSLPRHNTFEIYIRMPLNDHCKAIKKREARNEPLTEDYSAD